ncbi:hypothetical protein GNF10_05065 [Nostoc sp. UCD121]|uniref:hypothetical protein n=1 Tax=unclassified Nostoc TaxID=2593658 RepID=UPI00162A3B8C|nr:MULTISPECIES: hypothetical protein [unclassified Nostoc]MBC1222058.1 hypothetical protein [Nostoc sp. UCD120]MBC1275366.1 hypothetical protein [Nostoc sp. UCD121]MBC1293520.1 hypothetical protein [Nostoc sp. UCD122]
MNRIKVGIFTLLLILSLSVAHPAFASVCRNYDFYNGLRQHHQICILSINRSAKNYWEYKATVSVDGVKRPTEVYNCRERVKVQQGGAVLPFEQKDPGEMICSFFNSSRR